MAWSVHPSSTMGTLFLFLCMVVLGSVYCQAQERDLPRFTVTYLTMYKSQLNQLLDMSCDIYYGTQILLKFTAIKETVAEDCPSEATLDFIRDTGIRVIGSKVNCTVTLQVNATSNEDPSATEELLLDCVDNINLKFENLAELEGINGVKFDQVSGEASCPTVIMDPYKVFVESLVYFPGTEGTPTPSEPSMAATLHCDHLTFFLLACLALKPPGIILYNL